MEAGETMERKPLEGAGEQAMRPRDEREYQARYYLEHREEISARKKARYQADPEYRENAKSRVLKRYGRIMDERRAAGLAPGKRGLAKPRTVMIDGRETTVHGVGELLKRAEVGIQSLNQWEDRGILPPPTIVGKGGYRWYTEDHIARVARAVREHRLAGVWFQEDLKRRVEAEFAAGSRVGA